MDGLSVKEIRQIAKSRGVRGYYKLNKAALLSALEPLPPPDRISPPPSPSSTGLYFAWEDFHTRFGYPWRSKLGEGTFGTVFSAVHGTVAVKMFKNTDMKQQHRQKFIASNVFANAVVELSIYTRFQHPCLMPLLGWSYDHRQLYLAFPRGKSIVHAIRGKMLTTAQLIDDMTEGLAFLHSHGVVHGDIKENNVVFYDGHARLIDFGLAKYGLPALDDPRDLLSAGMAYTTVYRDPEYDTHGWNSARAEWFAMARAVHAIVCRVHEQYEVTSELYHTEDTTRYYGMTSAVPEVQALFDRYCSFPQSARPLSLYRPANPALGTVAPDPVIDEGELRPPPAIQALALEIFCVAVKINCRVQTTFLALDMLRRIAGSDSVASTPKKVLAPALLTLATAFFDEHIIDLDVLVVHTIQASPITRDDAVVSALTVSVMACEVLVMLHGQVFHRTYWDYLVAAGDVPLLLNQLLGMLIHQPFRTTALPTLATGPGTATTTTKDLHMNLLPRMLLHGDAPPAWSPLPTVFGGIPRRTTDSTGRAQLSHVVKQLCKLPGTDDHVDRHFFHYVNRLIALRHFWSLAPADTRQRIVEIFSKSPKPVMQHLWKWVGGIV